MSKNPYQPPNDAPNPTSGGRSPLPVHWYHSIVQPILKMTFAVGVILFIMGWGVLFALGDNQAGAAVWFAITAAFVSTGILVNERRFRVAGYSLLFVCSVVVFQIVSAAKHLF